MKLKTKIQKTEEVDIEFSTPAYYKKSYSYADASYVMITEEKIVSMVTGLTVMEMKYPSTQEYAVKIMQEWVECSEFEFQQAFKAQLHDFSAIVFPVTENAIL